MEQRNDEWCCLFDVWVRGLGRSRAGWYEVVLVPGCFKPAESPPSWILIMSSEFNPDYDNYNCHVGIKMFRKRSVIEEH